MNFVTTFCMQFYFLILILYKLVFFFVLVLSGDDY